MTGMLRVNLVKAILTRSCATIQKMDPYCTMKYKNKIISSNVIKGGGKTPEWHQVFEFKLNLAKIKDSEWTLECLDKDYCSSDLIGYTNIKMADLCIGPGKNQAAGVDKMFEL